jgi:hypothetical protein
LHGSNTVRLRVRGGFDSDSGLPLTGSSEVVGSTASLAAGMERLAGPAVILQIRCFFSDGYCGRTATCIQRDSGGIGCGVCAPMLLG